MSIYQTATKLAQTLNMDEEKLIEYANFSHIPCHKIGEEYFIDSNELDIALKRTHKVDTQTPKDKIAAAQIAFYSAFEEYAKAIEKALILRFKEEYDFEVALNDGIQIKVYPVGRETDENFNFTIDHYSQIVGSKVINAAYNLLISTEVRGQAVQKIHEAINELIVRALG